jgi:CIC family chloride channel protein
VRAAIAARSGEFHAIGLRARQAGVLAIVTGAVTGLAVAVFDRVVARGLYDRVLTAPLWVQAIVPGVGLAVAAVILRTVGHGTGSATTDEYIKAFHDPERRLELRPVPARLLASAATLGSGGAMGFEGPSMYMGAAIGTWLQNRWSRTFSREDNKLLMVCGAAAGVAAIFKAPATGMVFALEVPYRQDLARRMLLPAISAVRRCSGCSRGSAHASWPGCFAQPRRSPRAGPRSCASPSSRSASSSCSSRCDPSPDGPSRSDLAT